KLAKDLYKQGNIYILDEPTTGLHMSDIEKLLDLFNKMVDRGNTIIIIEHNTEVMKQADYIIDIGPDGGKNGGEVVFKGTPEEMIEKGDTITAKYLRKSYR
ncbi:MAG: excinuclease ABC subunit UvrA, partial [Clostridium sp.]|nr:excinuclease ABC subunit UvrA [Clostridium sp.]